MTLLSHRGPLLAALFALPLALTSPGEAPALAAILEPAGAFDMEPRGADSVAVSPDGSSIYVGRRGAGTLVHFARIPATGEIEFATMAKNGEGGVSGMSGPGSIAVSSDSAHVYVASAADSAVAVFARDAGTGALAFASSVVDGAGGVEGIGGVTSLTMSADGLFLYAAGVEDDAVAVFGRDVTTGALTFLEEHADFGATIHALGSIAISPDGLFLYASAGDVTVVYARSQVTGLLSSLQTFPHPTCLGAVATVVAPDGKHVYVSGWNRVTELDRDVSTGQISNARCDTVGGYADLAISPDGTHVYSASSHSLNQIRILERDPATGVLTYLSWLTYGFDPMSRFAMAWAPDGRLLVTGIRDFDVIAFDRDVASGAITAAEVGRADPPASIGEIAISEDGAHAYVTHPDQDGLSVFDRNPGTGDLTFTESHYGGFRGVTGLTGDALLLSPDGEHVYAFSIYAAGEIALFSRNAGTGSLTFVEAYADGSGVAGMDAPRDAAISEDGAHLYVSARIGGNGTIVRFARDPGSGSLTFLGFNWSSETETMAVSPDGKDVYVAVPSAHRLLHYAREAESGDLTLTRTYEAPGILSARGVSVPTDGRNVYLGRTEFARDDFTGELSYLGPVGGSPFVPKDAPLTSPDGKTVYMQRSAFHRHAESGRLHYVEPTSGLVRAVSPDGSHVYLSKTNRIEWQTPSFECAPAPLAGCGAAERGKLSVQGSILPFKRRVTWGWTNGGPYTLEEMGVGAVDQVFCLYDGSGTPFFRALIPAGGDCRTLHQAEAKPCWRVTSKSTKYVDRYLDPDGVKTLLLKPSQSSKSRIKFKALGRTMPEPELPAAPPVVAQLQARNGACWESTFATLQKNEEFSLKAKAP